MPNAHALPICYVQCFKSLETTLHYGENVDDNDDDNGDDEDDEDEDDGDDEDDHDDDMRVVREDVNGVNHTFLDKV